MARYIPPQGASYRTGDLDLTGYQTLMRETVYGTVIKPGDSQHSMLNMLEEGRADACIRLPHEKAFPLTPQEIELLQRWSIRARKTMSHGRQTGTC